MTSVLGVGPLNPTTNVGHFSITLRDRDDRADSADVIAERLKARAEKLAGAKLYIEPVQDIQITTRIEPLAISIHDHDGRQRGLAELVGQTVRRDAARAGSAQRRRRDADGRSAQPGAHRPQEHGSAWRLDAECRRHSQRRLRTAADFDDLHAVQPVSRDSRGVRAISARPEGAGKALCRARPAAVRRRRLEPSCISTASPPRCRSPIRSSFRRRRSASISRPARRSATRLQAIARIEHEIQHAVDRSSASFSGDAAEFSKSLASEPYLILAAVIAIYVVLGVLYESFAHPFTVLTTLPSAGVGALLALMLFRLDMSIVALIGIVLLMGIVKKNAIMMIDFALEMERFEGLSPEVSIVRACHLRFRPIMMTTLAALARRAAAGARAWCGKRIARPARHIHRRRPAAVANAHALHDAGHLSRRRAAAHEIWPARRGGRRRTKPSRRRRTPCPSARKRPNERLLAFHQTAGRHDAARARAVSDRRGRLFFLPVASLPAVDFPIIGITASAPRRRSRRPWRPRSPRRSNGGWPTSPASTN